MLPDDVGANTPGTLGRAKIEARVVLKDSSWGGNISITRNLSEVHILVCTPDPLNWGGARGRGQRRGGGSLFYPSGDSDVYWRLTATSESSNSNNNDSHRRRPPAVAQPRKRLSYIILLAPHNDLFYQWGKYDWEVMYFAKVTQLTKGGSKKPCLSGPQSCVSCPSGSAVLSLEMISASLKSKATLQWLWKGGSGKVLFKNFNFEGEKRSQVRTGR